MSMLNVYFIFFFHRHHHHQRLLVPAIPMQSHDVYIIKFKKSFCFGRMNSFFSCFIAASSLSFLLNR